MLLTTQRAQQHNYLAIWEGISKTFRTGRLERELQMVQLSATRCSCIAILWVSLVSFAAVTLCVASQLMFVVVVVVVVYFVIDSVRKHLDTPSFMSVCVCVLSWETESKVYRPVGGGNDKDDDDDDDDDDSNNYGNRGSSFSVTPMLQTKRLGLYSRKGRVVG
jgi:hypothetical protein